MMQQYALRGLNDDAQWETFVVLKAVARQEAIDLLEQYTVSHVRGCPYTAFKIDQIYGGFEALIRRAGCRAFVSPMVEVILTAEQEKRKLLVEAP